MLDPQGQAGLRDPGAAGRLCTAPPGAGRPGCRGPPASGGLLGASRSGRKGKTHSYRGGPGLGQAGSRRLEDRRRHRSRSAAATDREGRQGRRKPGRLGGVIGCRAIGQGDQHRALRRSRAAQNLRQTLSEVGRRPGADQVFAGAQLNANDGTVSGLRAGDRYRRQRPPRIVRRSQEDRNGLGLQVRRASGNRGDGWIEDRWIRYVLSGRLLQPPLNADVVPALRVVRDTRMIRRSGGSSLCGYVRLATTWARLPFTSPPP